MSSKLELKTAFAFKTQPVPFDCHTVTGIHIHVESDCIGMASKIAADIDTALQCGAVPAAQEVMINRINQAKEKEQPLVCIMEYGL